MFAKAICGILTQKEFIPQGIELLAEHIKEIDIISEVLPFGFTDYYSEEMGRELRRCWVAFVGLYREDSLLELKRETILLEDKTRMSSKRKFNFDPGIVTLSKLVLATVKNYSHRIAISRDIYAEVTLIYDKKKGFVPLEWTYPDYREEEALRFFNRVRSRLKAELVTLQDKP